MSKELNFLPEEYEEAKEKESSKSSGDGYMKFKEGENRFRILTKPVVGWLWWVDSDGNIVEKGSKPQKGNKPVRVDAQTNMTPEQWQNAKLFWAMQVWNYNENKAQILELTQVSIRDEIQSLIKDKDWGDPREYDLVVTRYEDEKTSYSVKPKPHKPFDRKGKDIPVVVLEALFKNKDPYSYKEEEKKVKENEDDLGDSLDDLDLSKLDLDD
jgi:hypothetical protein